MTKKVSLVGIVKKGLTLIFCIGIFLVFGISAPFLAGYQPTVILSGSMEPAIMTGDIVYIQKVKSFEELKTGDVIAFQRQMDATPITHRIVEIDENQQTLRTKGDSNDSEDGSTLSFSQVKGKVAGFRIPKAGYAVQFIKNPLVIGMIILCILINYIWGSSKIQNTTDKNEQNSSNKKGKRKK